MMTQQPEQAGLPAGWVSSRRGGWHNPNLAGYTAVIKPHRNGRTYGWAVFGRGRQQVAGWLNARSPELAALAAERAALSAAGERLNSAAATLSSVADNLDIGGRGGPAGLSRLAWCSVCRADTTAPAVAYALLNADGEFRAMCRRCYRSR